MKGICFKEPLFHATIEGGKTQTRRIMHPQPNDCTPDHPKYPMRLVFSEYDKDDRGVHCPTCGNGICFGDGLSVWKPRYNVGEVVYLKEPYNDTASQYRTLYKFDNDVEGFGKGFWRNKLFMPADLARHFIRITEVRAERLQEISDEDCIREGIECVPGDIEADTFALRGWDDGYSYPRDAYADLIDQINGRGTWESNPYVWVYDYELLKNR